jgi:hypothetical protein
LAHGGDVTERTATRSVTALSLQIFSPLSLRSPLTFLLSASLLRLSFLTTLPLSL